jgi:hypothetical protein
MKNLSAPLALALLAGAAAASDLTLRTIVLTGTPPPGLPTLTFDFLSDPRLASGGEVAFFADVAGPGVTEANNGTLWSDRTGALALVLREGDPTLLSPTTYYSAVPYPNFTDSLRLGVTAATQDSALPPSPPQPIRLGIFNEFATPPGFGPIARDGDAVPNFPPPGMNFSGIAPAPMTDSGLRAFASNKSGALWLMDDAGVVYGTFSGAPAAGVTSLRYGAFFEPAISPSGAVVFGATLVEPPPASTQPVGSGLWMRRSPFPTVELMARTGTVIQGTALEFKELSAHPVIVESGSGAPIAAFWSRLQGKATESDDTAIWVYATSVGTAPRIREGGPAAGAGVFFDELPRVFSMANEPNSSLAPAIAFRGSLRGSGVSDQNNSGVWLSRSGSLSMIAREGDQAPRLPAGTVFASFSDPVVTERGQVVFLARVRGGGTTGENSVVLYATELARPLPSAPAGRAVPVVRTGDAFPVSATETRIVHEVSFESQPKGTGFSAMDSAGSFLFKLTFKDPIVPPPPPPAFGYRFTEGLVEATVRCLADVNADGVLNLTDFGAFQTAYALGDLRKADSNGDGVLTLSDFGAFQTSFALGCP